MYASKTKSRRKNTPDSAFPRTLYNIFFSIHFNIQNLRIFFRKNKSPFRKIKTPFREKESFTHFRVNELSVVCALYVILRGAHGTPSINLKIVVLLSVHMYRTGSVFRIRPCGTVFSSVDSLACRLSVSNVKFPQM